MWKKNVLWPLLVVLLLALAAGGWWYHQREKPPGLMTAPVARGDLEITVLASGLVESDNLVSVGAQVSGQLKSLHVELGDAVRAGQLVAEIDSLPQQNTLRTRTAALAAVRAQKQAKEAALRQAELAFARQKQMLKSEASSRADYDSAEANLQVLRAEIEALKAQIDQATIAVDTARLDLGYTKISSPIDGVVVAIVTKEGQTVNANQSAPTIIKVAELERMSIRVEISEADVVKVRPGQRVYFTILGEPDKKYPAELQSIEPAPESIAKESTTANAASSSSAAIYYIGILEVPNPDGKLRISMTAEVNIVLAEAKDALLVPAAALGKKGKGGSYTVRVAEGEEQYRDQQVRVGLNNNVQAEVLEGLREGQQVVIGTQPAKSASPGGSGSGGPGMRRPPHGML